MSQIEASPRARASREMALVPAGTTSVLTSDGAHGSGAHMPYSKGHRIVLGDVTDKFVKFHDEDQAQYV